MVMATTSSDAAQNPPLSLPLRRRRAPRSLQAEETRVRLRRSPAARSARGGSTDRQIILLVFMLAGFAGLVYEVVWARQLVLVFGNTTQAISAILTGFFGGMAIGSVLGGRIADRTRSPLRMYAILEFLVVAGVLITPAAFDGIREVYRGAFGALEGSPFLLALVL